MQKYFMTATATATKHRAGLSFFLTFYKTQRKF
jgi:hypothetical protein